MKKIVQAGLIISGLASSLVASQTTDGIKHGAVNVSKDGSIHLKFSSPYTNPIIDVKSLTDRLKGEFRMNLLDSEQDVYEVVLYLKDKIHNCNIQRDPRLHIMRPIDTLRLRITEDENSTLFAEENIQYSPCYSGPIKPIKPRRDPWNNYHGFFDKNGTKNPWNESLEDSFEFFFDKNRTKGPNQIIESGIITCLPENKDKNNSKYKEECEGFNAFNNFTFWKN